MLKRILIIFSIFAILLGTGIFIYIFIRPAYIHKFKLNNKRINEVKSFAESFCGTPYSRSVASSVYLCGNGNKLVLKGGMGNDSPDTIIDLSGKKLADCGGVTGYTLECQFLVGLCADYDFCSTIMANENSRFINESAAKKIAENVCGNKGDDPLNTVTGAYLCGSKIRLTHNLVSDSVDTIIDLNRTVLAECGGITGYSKKCKELIDSCDNYNYCSTVINNSNSQKSNR